jgi:hypothetical protein
MILSTAVGLYISVKKINTTLPNAMTKYWKYEIKKDLFCQDNGDESDSHQLGVRQILNMGVFFSCKRKTSELQKEDKKCGERGSNTRPSDLQSDALPTELSPLLVNNG